MLETLASAFQANPIGCTLIGIFLIAVLWALIIVPLHLHDPYVDESLATEAKRRTSETVKDFTFYLAIIAMVAVCAYVVITMQP